MEILKSKLIKAADYSQMEITEEMLGTPLSEKVLQSKVEALVRKNVQMIEVEEVKKGDIGTFKLTSENEKFNRDNLPVNVGLGLFSRELEEQLIGMKKGEVRLFDLEGDKVQVQVKDIKRRVIPQVTDDMVRELDIEGVTNLEEYRNYLIAEDLKEQKIQTIPQYGYEYMINESEVELHEDDIAFKYREQKSQLAAYAALEGKSVEDYVREDLDSNMDKIEARLNETYPIVVALLGIKVAEEEGLEYTREDYEREMAQLAEEIEKPIEEAKKLASFEYHRFTWYQSQAGSKMMQYFVDKIIAKEI